ncbi:MAG: hypothetical protein JJLCMIEE_03111 [Acidimicrobiales bacterium]|nr:hypothetical protein [Acidimicrobiales bacterium]
MPTEDTGKFGAWVRGPREPSGAELVPAATVIVVRDTVSGLECLMLRRDSSLAFAGGMWVFPGGRVDPGDYPAGHPEDLGTAERNAAAREAAEEANVEIEPTALVRFSHWIPPPEAPKRFSTAFFITAAPDGIEVTVDDREIRAHLWIHATEAMARRDAGEIELAPPTFITLHRLAGYRSVADALADSVQREVEEFATRVSPYGESFVALYHGDAGYESCDAELAGPRHRLWLGDRWLYERNC